MMMMRRRANVMATLLAFFLVLGLIALVLGGCAVSAYNRAIAYEERATAQWAQVENQMQRRYDLVPNLVETVKGYAGQEKEIFTDIANARTKYFQGNTPEDKIEASRGLERALSRLLVLKESYPELKSQANFLALQDQLEGTENRLAFERKKYNEDVRALRQYSRSFFGRLATGWAGVSPDKLPYFEVTDENAREAPKVKFNG